MIRTFFRNNSPANRIADVTLLCLALGLLILAIVRAIIIPLTHDEALSLSMFAVKPISEIFSYQDAGGLPNNHILNTLWMKLAAATIGESTLALRTGNLIGLVLFLYAALRLLSRLPAPLLRIGGFLLLCCNPFMFDFFSLARGYGMSNGLLLLSVCLLSEYRERPSVMLSAGIFSAALLMVLANLNTVHVFAAIAVSVFALNLAHRKPVSWKTVYRSASAPLIAALVLGAFVYFPFTEIIHRGGTFGGETGFWEDCVKQLIAFSTYDASYALTMETIISWLIILLLVIMPVAAVYYAVRKQNNFLLIALVLLLLPALTTVLQHLVFGSEFPVARTVLYLHVLFVVALIALAASAKQKVAVPVFMLFGSLLLFVHFCMAMQKGYAIQWAYDAGNRDVLDEVQKLRADTRAERVTIGITWIYEPGLNYECKRRNYQWLVPLTQDGIAGEYDYFYVSPEDSLTLSQRGKKVIAYYPKSRTSLMK